MKEFPKKQNKQKKNSDEILITNEIPYYCKDSNRILKIKNMITDDELFELIKRAVKQRKAVPHHSTQNFAQRYCSQQLAKKKLIRHQDHKMTSILKKFSTLDTYFNLPELLNAINMIKTKQSWEPRRSAPTQFHNISKTHQKFTDRRGLRYVIDSPKIQDFLLNLENGNLWKGELSNNSPNGYAKLLSRIISQNEENNQQVSFANFFTEVERNKSHGTEISRKQKDINIKQSQLNSQKKKQYTNFLHKASSYLQIILETQHKTKWKHDQRKQNSLSKTNFLQTANIYQKLQNGQRTPQTKVFTRQTSSLHLTPKKRQSNPIQQKIFTKNNVQNTKKSPFFKSNSSWQKLNFKETSSSFSGAKQMKQIRDAFTFKRRSVKQKIISKLNKFIDQIDEETHCNKKENSYYNSQINQLQDRLRNLFGRYKRQTIAGERQIADLKQLASQFQVKPSQNNTQRSSNQSESKIGK